MKTNLHVKYAMDPIKETAGTDIDIGGGVTLRIARWGNPVHVAAQNRLRAPYADRLAVGLELSVDEVRFLTAQAVAEGVLLGWTGVLNEDGVPVPYAPAAAAEIMADPDMHDFTDKVISHALKADAFRRYADSAIAGNSAAS